MKTPLTKANAPLRRHRPLSPNIQIYRPQLTSVLSIVNRISGVVLAGCAVILVVWLNAAAGGHRPFAVVHAIIGSWPGQIMLLCGILAFFLHLLGGIRHLVWDSVHGFELSAIYASGWVVVGASVVLTALAFVASLFMRG